MNNKRYMFLGLLAITLLSFGGVSLVSAYRGDPNQTGPNYSPERHTTMQRAFETNDYNLWKSQMGDRGVTRVINEGNFARFAEAYRLAKEGRYEDAQRIRQELGLNAQNRNGRNMMNGGNCGCANSNNNVN